MSSEVEDDRSHGKIPASLYAGFRGRSSAAVLLIGANWIFGIWSHISARDASEWNYTQK